MDATTSQTAAADTAPTQGQSHSFDVDLTPAEIQQMANWAVEDGSLSREQADAMLKGESAPPGSPANADQPEPTVAYAEDIPGLPVPDLSDPAMAAEHAAYMDIPAEGKPYEFDYGTGEIDPKFVNEAQGLCRAMELPQWLAKYTSKQYVKAESALKAGRLTQADIELAHSKAEFQLRGLWGDQYEAKVRAAQSTIRHLPADKQARVVDILSVTGLGNDPLLISHLATLAQHRAARKGK